MTAQRVPRQQRGADRRDALLAAAITLITAHGPAAFSARGVAAEAGLPLAAVSYYFPQLDVLLGEAITAVLTTWLTQAENVAAATETGHPDPAADPTHPGTAARAITAALLPPGDRTAVLHRYQHMLAAAEHPLAAAAMADVRPRLATMVERILRGTATRTELSPDALIAFADGAAVGAASEGVDDPRQRVEDTLRAVLAAQPTVSRSGSQPIQSSNDRPEIRS